MNLNMATQIKDGIKVYLLLVTNRFKVPSKLQDLLDSN